jgi:BMFP domain-containing protein YqiC
MESDMPKVYETVVITGRVPTEAEIHQAEFDMAMLMVERQDDEIAALRSKLRALSAPLPSDPDGRMWSTRGYFANREGDDLDTEVMAWAMSAITALRRRVAELEAELEEYEHAASYDATLEGPVFKGWNRSSLDRARKRTEARRALDGGGNG